MTPPGQWIRAARQELGLSTRELAALAGVAYPTISRIEKGHTPNLGGTPSPRSPALSGSPASWTASTRDRWSASPTWSMHGSERRTGHRSPTGLSSEPSPISCAVTPSFRASAGIDNLLAASAERVADELGLRRPRWTRLVEPLAEPWEVPGTPRMRAANAANTAPQFAARGLLIPEASIWRDRSPALT
jgi:hypothetical protein